jgi:FlaA1/EpsC-like NDP-sugar epimerase
MISGAVINRALELPRATKRLIALSIDAVMCVVSVWFAFYLRLGYWPHLAAEPAHPVLASIAIALPIFVSFGLYRAIFRYAGSEALITIARAVALYSLPFMLIYTVIGIDGTPRTIGIIQPILLLLLISASRTLARTMFGESYTRLWRASDKPRVLIYGAGVAGRELASALNGSSEMRLVGFIDDDAALWRSTMFGVPIFSPDAVEREVEKQRVTDILLAIPSSTRARRAEIVTQLRELGVHVRTLPSMLDIARGAVSVGDLKDLEIEDLLGRSPIPPDEHLLRMNITGKVVMVTGAGGSIGSELCRQIIRQGPALLLLVDLSEFNLYAIHKELSRVVADSENVEEADDIGLLPLLASVSDARRMEEIISTWLPDTIYHAAAYKHVPLVEHNAVEGIRNNVYGTLTTARLAREYRTANFVLISTDKAVRPTNIMGTSKRLAEMVLQAMHEEGGQTCFSMVRFGNVLGSSGSVVPLFRDQISSGGPITITHADITRYFMTIPEAAQLVLQAGAMGTGGDVFVLDMGEPVRIVDLARNMIELSGLTVRDEETPDGDIAIDIVGLRPGEKLYEELLIGNDPIPSSHPRIMRSHEHFLPWRELGGHFASLSAALDAGDAAAARATIRMIVPEYQPNSNLVDLVSEAKIRAAAG